MNKIILNGILSSELIFKEVLEHVWLCFLCDDMDKVTNDHQSLMCAMLPDCTVIAIIK